MGTDITQWGIVLMAVVTAVTELIRTVTKMYTKNNELQKENSELVLEIERYKTKLNTCKNHYLSLKQRIDTNGRSINTVSSPSSKPSS